MTDLPEIETYVAALTRFIFNHEEYAGSQAGIVKLQSVQADTEAIPGAD